METLLDQPIHHVLPAVALSDAGSARGIPTGYMGPQAIARREETLTEVPDGVQVVHACGDDRELAPGQAERVQEKIIEVTGQDDTMSMEDGFASIWGGPVGEAVLFLAAGVANIKRRREKRAFINRIGGLAGAVALVRTARGPRGVLHSDEGHEGSLHFSQNTETTSEEVGCLYNGGLGYILGILTKDRGVKRRIRQDVAHAFGEERRKDADPLIKAFDFLLGQLEHGRSHSFGRKNYHEQQAAGTPVVVLKGHHARTRFSGFLLNFHTNKVTNPRKTARMGMHDYRMDIGRVTYDLGGVLANEGIRPLQYMEAGIALSTAVRAALVSKDPDPRLHGKLKPEQLPMGVVGDAQTAAAEIERTYPTKPRPKN